METRKLYYEDCMMQEFTARVLDCRETKGGFWVTLDATAFYPEGGGQACDLGVLGGASVLDVQEDGETVLHLCRQPLPVGETVKGVINWVRRFDLMQQHAGEHIVSGIIHKMFGGHNVGFHVGADVMTVDFDVPIPGDALLQIEKQANQAVFDDVPLRCWYPTEQALPHVIYRTKKPLPYPVRIVEIPGYDSCACCGIHVARTGQIGLIKLLSCVKFHQGVRMEMVCGSRAVKLMGQIFEQNRQVSQAFSAKLLETGEAARRNNEQLNKEKYRAAALERQLCDTIAERYVNCGDVLYVAQGFEMGMLRELGDRIAQRCGGTAAVFSGSDRAGYQVCLVNKQKDVSDLGKAMTKALQGRGGGRDGFFQGSVNASQKRIAAFFTADGKAFCCNIQFK